MIQREHLMTGTVGRQVDRVEAHRVRLEPGQQSGAHHHPGGVAGYVVEGTIKYQAEGEKPQELTEGSTFFEPAGKTITNFDNVSTEEPATFIAYYLLTGQQELIVHDS